MPNTNLPTTGVTIYQTDSGNVEVRLEQDTVWLRQEQLSQLFGRERSVITKHLRNVFAEGELDQQSNVQNLHIAGSGNHDSLDHEYAGDIGQIADTTFNRHKI